MSIQSSHSASSRSVVRAKEVPTVTDCFDFYYKTKRGRRAGAGRRPSDCIGDCG